MSGLSTVLIVVGLFLLGGIYSFVKQKHAEEPHRAALDRRRDVSGRRRHEAGGLELSASTASKKVVVFDYGFGNVRSAERALARAGADVEITA